MDPEDYNKLPVEDRCVHKQWQARKHGYEEAAKNFRQIDDDKSPEFGKFLGLVKKFVVDSHAVGQEKGLEATLAFVENYAHAGKTVGDVMSGVINKCIAAPKTRTRELAVQVILMYIEIEKGEYVQEELLKGMDHKNPKIVAACISTFTEALKEFGSKIINVKPLVKKITVLFSDRDKGVRDEAGNMVVEIYRWIGGALRSQLNNLKPVQITELEAEFSKLDSQKATPNRYIRSEQHKQMTKTEYKEEVDGEPACIDGDEVDPPEMSPYELADPVEILSKLPKDFFEKLEAKKWQERKEALECLEKLVQSPKLEGGDYGDLIRALKKVIDKDTNVVVVALAVKCLGGVAAGLRNKFQPYAVACISSLLEKFKEKKQNVVAAIKDAIDVIYLATTLESILEDAIEALAKKNPSIKSETSLFLARSFSKTQPTVINKKILKAICSPLVINMNESDPIVRDSAAEAIGTLMKLVGEKSINPFIVSLEKDGKKMEKIKECCEKAIITVRVAAVKKGRPTTAPVKATKNEKSVAPTKSAPAPGAKAAAVKKKAVINSATVVRPKGKNIVAKKTTEKELSDEQAEETVLDIIDDTIVTGMCDTDYKVRLASVDEYFKKIKSMNSADIPTQALLKILSKKPGLKDTNFQVLQMKLEIIKFLAENCNFSSTSANICINDVIDKIGDLKNGSLAQATMTSLAEATSLSFVSSILLDFSLNQKSPKVITETFAWLGNAIKEFGISDLNIAFLIDSAKKGLTSTNPTVRQSAITYCGILYLFIQNPLYGYFENEKPALREQINTEFHKYQGMKPPIPIRGLSKSASSNSLDNVDEDEDGGSTEPIKLQDLLPRTDISSQMTESLLNELEDKNWKVRIEALTKITQIIQDAKLIKSNLGDLPPALCKRMGDSNKQVAQTAMNVCETIAKAMGTPSKQYIKVFFPMFLRNWGDNKTQLRTVAKDTIDVYVDQAGSYKEFFENEMISDALKTGTPQLKIELWDWLAEILPKIPLKTISREELVICIPILFSHLEDRLSDIRANSHKAILGVMIHVGYEGMLKNLEKLKPASQYEIRKKLENERANLPVQIIPKKIQIDENKTVKVTKSATTKNVAKAKSVTASTKPTVSTSNKKKEEDVDTSPLLVVSNLKQQRLIDETKLKVLRWNFTTPREEFVDLLRDQMTTANFNKTLIASLFRPDFSYHIKALDSLMEDLNENEEALISNLDLVLKWLTLRFFDTNPSVVFKGLEYLNSVFSMLIARNYKLLESEASSFLPYLVMKIGDAKFCNAIRALFKQICHVCPVHRVFFYAMEGVKSKNARQRAECLDLMGTIIQDYGISVCGPTPAGVLKEVAKQISDKDKSVRNSALNCIVEAYYILGEKIYKMIGNIVGKDLALLEGRIKHSKRTTICKTEIQQPQPEPEIVYAEADPVEIKQDIDDYEEEILPSVVMSPKPVPEHNEAKGPFALDPELLARLDNMYSPVKPLKLIPIDLDFLKEPIEYPEFLLRGTNAKQHNLPSPKKRQDPVLLKILMELGSKDSTVALQALEALLDLLSSNRSNAIVDEQNEFARAVVKQLRHLRSKEVLDNSPASNIYRKLLTAIDSFYKNKEVGKEISEQHLQELIDEFIYALVSGKFDNASNGEAYIRVMNQHCLKIIERSNPTRIICALVRLLHECIKQDRLPRYTELVMKSLWKIIKLLPNWSEDVDYDSVLLSVHQFLKDYPSTWWKNKPTDTPVRTIKTIIHSCIKIRGALITTHFTKIPKLNESEIEIYIMKLLRNMNLETIPPTSSQRVQLSRATHGQLTEIFQKIGQKDETKEGLTLLYDFMQQNPEADIDPFLKKSSKFFQDYIQNGLQEIEESRKGFKSVKETVEEKASELLTSSQDNVVDKGPEYWYARLEKWKNFPFRKFEDN